MEQNPEKSINILTSMPTELDPTVHRRIRFKRSTLSYIKEVGELTGRRGLYTVIQDALRWYVWALKRMSWEERVMALKQADIDALEKNESLNGTREALPSFIKPQLLGRARQFFE